MKAFTVHDFFKIARFTDALCICKFNITDSVHCACSHCSAPTYAHKLYNIISFPQEDQVPVHTAYSTFLNSTRSRDLILPDWKTYTLDVCVSIPTHIVSNGMSMNFNQGCVNILIAIFTFITTLICILNIVHVKIVVLVLCIDLYWCSLRKEPYPWNM
jgi:hypothetical protein